MNARQIDGFFKYTPEGQVFFRFGRLGSGYQVPPERAATLRKLLAIGDTLLIGALLLVWAVRWLGHLDQAALGLLIIIFAAMAGYLGATGWLLRGCPRSAERLTNADVLRSRGRLEPAWALAMLAGISGLLGLVCLWMLADSLAHPGEATIIALGFLALCGLVLVYSLRLQKLRE